MTLDSLAVPDRRLEAPVHGGITGRLDQVGRHIRRALYGGRQWLAVGVDQYIEHDGALLLVLHGSCRVVGCHA
jgi:hypothetical protein